MNEQDIPSAVYAFESDERSDIAVKRAKQQFAEDYDYDYGDVMGQKLQRIPAYGIRVYVCHEPSLFADERP
jgi:hypothetical protein